ncbi:hypothetical protein H4R21_001215 [Coemansia helicoidea]|uniref:Uncharacterized protein n=1 Tax=Coemansia helicoidea TaxID=1286919 RepID=A0ACC1LCC6_9FUNG|nr:hypothetical protein H4R21_001215 [Coemansia helicoidea]
MLGRLVYVHKATYGKRKAILKLAWTPVSRQPEGAVYDALAAKGVGDVPEVFDSGILCKDMFGYRLEYIILQDCGETLDEHLAKLHADDEDEDDDVIEAKLIRAIQRVSACLVRAWNAGIIHRDISTGNIAVDGNKVAVIDWGYAKVCEWTGLEDVAQRWDIDFEEICEVESTYDKQAGTPIFMSIGLLFGRGKRDVYDDLESLFYVALYAIGGLDNKKIDNAHGFQFYSSKNLALVRASVLGNRNRYLERFDVIGIGNDLQKVLDAMHQCLFWTHSGYIGDNLWEDEYFRREPDWQLAAEFMDRETVQMLKQAQPTQDGAQPPPAPASVSSAQPSPAPTIASSVQQQPAPAPEYGYQMGASPAHALDARMDSVGDLCNAEPASRPQDTSGSYASSRYKRKSKDGGGMQSPKRSRMSGRGKENADSAR